MKRIGLLGQQWRSFAFFASKVATDTKRKHTQAVDQSARYHHTAHCRPNCLYRLLATSVWWFEIRWLRQRQAGISLEHGTGFNGQK